MPSSGGKTCALRSEEHTSELKSHDNLVCRLLLEKKPAVGIFSGCDLLPKRTGQACVGRSWDERYRRGLDPREIKMNLSFFLNKTPPTKISPFSPHDPLPI